MKGQRFGMLTVVDVYRVEAASGAYYRCICDCDCGGRSDSRASELTRKSRPPIRSCGCLGRGRHAAERARKHGGCSRSFRSPEHTAWVSMKTRCATSSGRTFRNYGARGIRVCDAWAADFEVFLRDMGPRPSAKHSLDRIANDGNYEPGNCRWATASEQIYNQRKRGRSAFRGVFPSGSGWSATLTIAGRPTYLGTFATPELAAAARDKACTERGIVQARNLTDTL